MFPFRYRIHITQFTHLNYTQPHKDMIYKVLVDSTRFGIHLHNTYFNHITSISMSISFKYSTHALLTSQSHLSRNLINKFNPIHKYHKLARFITQYLNLHNNNTLKPNPQSPLLPNAIRKVVMHKLRV